MRSLEEILLSQEDIDFESLNDVWNLKLFGLPVWYAVRARLPGIEFRRKLTVHQILGVLFVPFLLAFLLIKIWKKDVIVVEPRQNLLDEVLTYQKIGQHSLLITNSSLSVYQKIDRISDWFLVSSRAALFIVGLASTYFFFWSPVYREIREVLESLNEGDMTGANPWRMVIAKCFSDNITSLIFHKLTKTIVFCGGSLSNAVSFCNPQEKKVTEIAHAFIGPRHHMYAEVKAPQCALVCHSNCYKPMNRLTLEHKSDGVFQGRRYQVREDANVVLVESGQGLVRALVKKKFWSIDANAPSLGFTVVEHPIFRSLTSKKDESVVTGSKFFVEPSSEILTLRAQGIPITVVCEKGDEKIIQEYFGVGNLNFCTNRQFLLQF